MTRGDACGCHHTIRRTLVGIEVELKDFHVLPVSVWDYFQVLWFPQTVDFGAWDSGSAQSSMDRKINDSITAHC